jgi:hypothetical protein
MYTIAAASPITATAIAQPGNDRTDAVIDLSRQGMTSTVGIQIYSARLRFFWSIKKI